jgi:hypothetical protein
LFQRLNGKWMRLFKREIASTGRSAKKPAKSALMLGHLLVHAFFRHTRFGQFFNGLMLLLGALALPVGSVAGLSIYAWKEVSRQSDYQKRFGQAWKAEYEANQGSLSAARGKVMVAIAGAFVNTLLGIWLYRQLTPALRKAGYSSRPRRKRRARK